MNTAKDWTGNYNSIYTTLGASNHSNTDRESNDYYATDPKAAELLCEQLQLHDNIWECAVGEGHLAHVFEAGGYNVRCSDLINRGYPNTETIDFLTYNGIYDGDIVTNPPYKYAQEFVEKALSVITDGKYVAMFLKIQFLEGKKRRLLFDKYPPKHIYVLSSRLKCAMNGDFDSIGSSAVAYAWFVWEKGYTGKPTVEWIN